MLCQNLTHMSQTAFRLWGNLEYMELPYSMYTAVYARAIQEHQKRLDRMKLKEMGEDVKF